MPLAALAARIQAVWARCGGEGDAAVAARSSPLALLAGLEVGFVPWGHIACVLIALPTLLLPTRCRPCVQLQFQMPCMWACSRSRHQLLETMWLWSNSMMCSNIDAWAQARVEEVVAATASLPADAVAAVERVRERERWQVHPLARAYIPLGPIPTGHSLALKTISILQCKGNKHYVDAVQSTAQVKWLHRWSLHAAERPACAVLGYPFPNPCMMRAGVCKQASAAKQLAGRTLKALAEALASAQVTYPVHYPVRPSWPCIGRRTRCAGARP